MARRERAAAAGEENALTLIRKPLDSTGRPAIFPTRSAAEAASRSVWPILYTPESLITILVCRSSYYRFCLKSPNVSGVDFSEYWSFYISC